MLLVLAAESSVCIHHTVTTLLRMSTLHIHILQGLSMFTISDELLLYGGDKSGLAVCAMAGADWKWAAPAITGGTSSAAVLTSTYMMLAQAVVCTSGYCLMCCCCCGQTACLHQ